MEKNIYLLAVVICLSACNSSVDIDEQNNMQLTKTFEKNCETVSAYVKDWTSEDLDYSKYYVKNAYEIGTTFGSKDTLTLDDKKATYKAMWQKYDFSVSEPLNLLPGVNSETKKMDGSVRFYYTLNVTVTETQRSVSIPLYKSLEFNDEGKITWGIFYGDISAYFGSLETE